MERDDHWFSCSTFTQTTHVASPLVFFVLVRDGVAHRTHVAGSNYPVVFFLVRFIAMSYYNFTRYILPFLQHFGDSNVRMPLGTGV